MRGKVSILERFSSGCKKTSKFIRITPCEEIIDIDHYVPYIGKDEDVPEPIIEQVARPDEAIVIHSFVLDGVLIVTTNLSLVNTLHEIENMEKRIQNRESFSDQVERSLSKAPKQRIPLCRGAR